MVTLFPKRHSMYNYYKLAAMVKWYSGLTCHPLLCMCAYTLKQFFRKFSNLVVIKMLLQGMYGQNLHFLLRNKSLETHRTYFFVCSTFSSLYHGRTWHGNLPAFFYFSRFWWKCDRNVRSLNQKCNGNTVVFRILVLCKKSDTPFQWSC